MTVVLVLLTVLVSLVLLATGGAKLAAIPDMRTRASHLGFSVTTFRVVGALEVAGVAGLQLGWQWPTLGLVAAVALTLLMLGAVVCHVRVGDPLREAVPALVVTAVLVAVVVLRLVTA